MKITQAEWNNYTSKMSALSTKASEEFVEWANANGGWRNIDRQLLAEAGWTIASKYAEGSSALAASMYEAIAQAEHVNVPSAELSANVDFGMVAKAINGALKHSDNDNFIADPVGRAVKQAGADTMLKNASRDHAEFAWIPVGDTCPFCLVLASNGWRRASKKTTNGGHADHIHTNCNCQFAIRFNKNTNVEGYDPEAYQKMYYDAEGKNAKEKIKSLQAKYYQEHKEDINAKKRINRAISKNKEYFMKYGNIEKIETQKIEAKGETNTIIFSDSVSEYKGEKVYLSNKIITEPEYIMNTIEPYLDKAFDIIGTEHGPIPKFVITDLLEMKDVSGRYLYDTNTVILSPMLFDINNENNQFEYNTHLTLHELFHWSDCQDMAKEHPGLKEDDLVEFVNKWAKEKVESLGITIYNVKEEVSDYASDKLKIGRFDEVYVEYRVKQIMRDNYDT